MQLSLSLQMFKTVLISKHGFDKKYINTFFMNIISIKLQRNKQLSDSGTDAKAFSYYKITTNSKNLF